MQNKNKKKDNMRELGKFYNKISSEKKSIKMFEKLRWNNKIECPYSDCSSTKGITKRPQKKACYRCKGCKRDFTSKTGTIFENSHISYHRILSAIYLMTNMGKGVSASELSTFLGVAYTTAWQLQHKIRICMKENPNYKLAGTVQIDETYIGGKEKNKHLDKQLKNGGKNKKRMLLGITVAKKETRMFFINNRIKETIQKIIYDNVEPESIIHTDQAPCYKSLSSSFKHDYVNHGDGQYVKVTKEGKVHTNAMESMWNLVKKTFYGTYYNFSEKYTQRYLDEISFRINEKFRGHIISESMERVIKSSEGKKMASDISDVDTKVRKILELIKIGKIPFDIPAGKEYPIYSGKIGNPDYRNDFYTKGYMNMGDFNDVDDYKDFPIEEYMEMEACHIPDDYKDLPIIDHNIKSFENKGHQAKHSTTLKLSDKLLNERKISNNDIVRPCKTPPRIYENVQYLRKLMISYLY